MNTKLKKRIEYAYKNYKPIRTLYEKHDINIDDVEFEQLPYVDKFYLSNFSLAESSAVDLVNITRIFTTSGTTSNQQFVLFTENDWNMQQELLKDSFEKIGISAEDIFYDSIPKTTIFGGYVALGAAEKLGATVISAGKLDKEQHVELICNTCPTVLNGIACFIIKIAYNLPSYIRENIRIICLVGEYLTESVRKQVLDCYPNAKVYSGYGISEICVANECINHDGFHFDPKLIQIELSKEKEEDEYGEVVFTSLFSEAMPLIRYKSGDKGVLYYDNCSCGCRWPRVKILGRIDKMTNIRGKLVSLELLKNYVYSIKGIVGAYCKYYPSKEQRFEIIYEGSIDENELINTIKQHFDITPVVMFKEIGLQWKNKFFIEVN